MLLNVKELSSYRVHALDGDMGKVHEFFFDDETWQIRYLVVDTRRWLPGRKVLVATAGFRRPEPEEKRFPVSLTKEQVEGSPAIEADKPVSRQRQMELHEHYGWPPYWPPGGYYEVPLPRATVFPPEEQEEKKPQGREAEGDPHLRNTREVTGYGVRGGDGEAGEVDDLVLDAEEWVVRYLIVDTGKWLPGKKVLVPVGFVREISWDDKSVSVVLRAEDIKDAPAFDPSAPVDGQVEERLRDYYGSRPMEDRQGSG
jgi:sporulation protein YlmC with PRC-barrel domain